MARQKGWRKDLCALCAGSGMQSAYTMDGSDFDGATECRRCGGNGVVWISPKGKMALYPGGPWTG